MPKGESTALLGAAVMNTERTSALCLKHRTYVGRLFFPYDASVKTA